MKFGVSSAWLVGDCSKCSEPSTGKCVTDDESFCLTCVSCRQIDTYVLDELGHHYIELELEEEE